MRLLTLVFAAALPLAASADTVYRVSSFASERSPGEIVRVSPGPDLQMLHLPTAMRIGTFDATAQRLFLLGDSYDPKLYLVDLHDQSMVATAVDTSALSSCCGWDAQTSGLFAIRGGNELVRVDATTGAVTKVLTLPARFSMLSSDPARGRSFLLREDTPEVWLLDLATLTPSMLRQTAVMSAFIDASTGTLYISTPLEGESFLASDLIAIDVDAGTARVVLHHPGGVPVAYDSVTKQVYVQKWNDFNLTEFWSVDLATGLASLPSMTGGDFNSYLTVAPPPRKRAVR